MRLRLSVRRATRGESRHLTIGDKHLKELESLLLRVIRPRPKGNSQSGKFAKSQSLLRQFRSDMNAHYKQEWYSIIGKKAKNRDSERGEEARTALARYMTDRRPFTIKAVYKGKTYKARVRRDGSIRMNGRVYSSPSAAGGEVKGGACNGWGFWRYERAPGDWVRLRKLRS
jgi:hypothetical protein